MSRHPAFQPIDDMETDVRDVGRWAEILSHMATSSYAVQEDDLHLISTVLRQLGKRLVSKWEGAYEAVRGQP